MRIRGPQVKVIAGQVEYSASYSTADGREHVLWFHVPERYGDLVSDRLDAALLALLIPAMSAGSPVIVDGPVTEALLSSLRRGYQDILSAVVRRLKPVPITADWVEPAHSAEGLVATGFSCGVDSYTVLADHLLDPEAGHGPTIDLGLFNNVGSHGDSRTLFLRRLDRVQQAAVTAGLPLLSVDSNLAQVYKPLRLGFDATHTPRNAAVAFLLQNGISTWLYASAYPLSSARVAGATKIAYTDAVALPLLSNEQVHLVSSGGEYNRFQKVRRIVQIPDTYEYLDVCVRPGLESNCSECWKCLRTMGALDILGVLDRYSAVFDLDKWASSRRHYLGTARISEDPLTQELWRAARDEGVALPRPTASDAIGALLNRSTRGFLTRGMRRVRSISGSLPVR